MSQFYSIRRPSSIEIMVEEEPLPPTERFDSPFIGHRVLLPSGQQELVSSLRCKFSSCIRMRLPIYVLYVTYRVIEIRYISLIPNFPEKKIPKNIFIFSSENNDNVLSKKRCE